MLIWRLPLCSAVGKSYITPNQSITNMHAAIWEALDFGVSSDFQGEWKCGDILVFKITIFRVAVAFWCLMELVMVWNCMHLPRELLQERAPTARWSLSLRKLRYLTCLMLIPLPERGCTNSPDWTCTLQYLLWNSLELGLWCSSVIVVFFLTKRYPVSTC